jgi:hypothetical protein
LHVGANKGEWRSYGGAIGARKLPDFLRPIRRTLHPNRFDIPDFRRRENTMYFSNPFGNLGDDVANFSMAGRWSIGMSAELQRFVQ